MICSFKDLIRICILLCLVSVTLHSFRNWSACFAIRRRVCDTASRRPMGCTTIVFFTSRPCESLTVSSAFSLSFPCKNMAEASAMSFTLASFLAPRCSSLAYSSREASAHTATSLSRENFSLSSLSMSAAAISPRHAEWSAQRNACVLIFILIIRNGCNRQRRRGWHHFVRINDGSGSNNKRSY